MKLLFYSKFVFENNKPSNKPSQTPRQTVGKNIDKQKQKSQDIVKQKRKVGESYNKSKEKLLKYWQNNNPKAKIEVLEDDPKAIVFHEIRDPLRAKEAYMLMSLIEQYWQDMGGLDLAMRLYKQAKAGRKKAYDIDFQPFENFFRKGNHAGSATERLGFYFWKSKNEWYTYDKDEDSNDEACGSTYLVKSLTKIRSEFADKSNKDSGLTIEEESSVLDSIKKNLKESSEYYKLRYREKGAAMVKWFIKNAENKWTALNDKVVKQMNILFGAGVGKYLYRYNAKQKRVYFLKLQGASLTQREGESGYVDIKDGKLGKWTWHNDINELKKNLIDKMEPDTVLNELLSEKTKAGEKVDEDRAAELSKKILIKIHKVKKFKYSNISTSYTDRLEKSLKQELVKTKGFTESKAESIASAAVARLKKNIDDQINKDPQLKKAKEKDLALKVTLDKNGEPKVQFAKSKDRLDIKKTIDKAKKAASDAGLDKVIDQKTKDIMKGLGPLGILLKWFKVDIKEDVAKYFKTGNKSLALTLVTMFSSVSIGRRILRGKGFDSSKDIEKYLGKNKQAVLKKDQTFNKEFKPQGYKITIPKGKGIKPGETFTANGEVISPEKKKKEKKKVGFSFLAIFGSKKSTSTFVGQDKEIIITQNDKVPRGTVIPKGAKIEKV